MIHAPKPLKKLRRPTGALGNGALQRSDNEAIPADAERFCAAVNGFQQGGGNMHSRRHEYIYEYIGISAAQATGTTGRAAVYLAAASFPRRPHIVDPENTFRHLLASSRQILRIEPRGARFTVQERSASQRLEIDSYRSGTVVGERDPT